MIGRVGGRGWGVGVGVLEGLGMVLLGGLGVEKVGRCGRWALGIGVKGVGLAGFGGLNGLGLAWVGG